jgi:hypothetical protein
MTSMRGCACSPPVLFARLQARRLVAPPAESRRRGHEPSGADDRPTRTMDHLNSTRLDHGNHELLKVMVIVPGRSPTWATLKAGPPTAF